MMKIELNKKFRIAGNEKCYVLEKKFKEDRWIAVSFFTSIESCLRDFISNETRASNVKSIEELIDFQKELISSLNKALQPLKIEVRQ